MKNVPSKGLSLLGRCDKGLPGVTGSWAGSLLSLESCNSNMDICMWGARAAEVLEQAHSTTQLPFLWPFSGEDFQDKHWETLCFWQGFFEHCTS